jgi:hypothetical protein
MIGAIRTWDVLRHPWVTIQCFGWRTFLRALAAGPKDTFLSLLNDGAFFGFSDSEASDIVQQCIDLELRAKQLYLTLAEATAHAESPSQLFLDLAEQQQEHADLLRLCMAASNHVGWRRKDLPLWRKTLLRLNQEMLEAELHGSEISDLDGAMRLVVQVESSGVNQVVLALIAASNSEFVKKLRPFQYSVEMHLSYIAARIPPLARPVEPEQHAEEPLCVHSA